MFTAPEVQATIPRMRRIGILAALTLVACGETKTEIVTVPGECADGSVDADPEGSVEGGADSTSEVATDGAIDTTTPPDGADAATDAATDGSDGGPGCTLKEGGDLCTKVPNFVGTQGRRRERRRVLRPGSHGGGRQRWDAAARLRRDHQPLAADQAHRGDM